MAKNNPSGRLCKPADIAGAAAFLLSDDAAGVNAQVLHVDGGGVVR
jgi:NAD(P)-dependent dehydrogenase (short-subunit alcohol dehydrogenase family)